MTVTYSDRHGFRNTRMGLGMIPLPKKYSITDLSLMVKSTQLNIKTWNETMARVLFVDDDLLTLETYSTIISYFGHDVLVADNAEQAIQMAIQDLPDILVLDMNMPDMHGFDLLRKLRKYPQTANIPAVMVSASPDAFADSAIAAGAQEFRSKPVRPDELLALIDQYTDNDA